MRYSTTWALAAGMLVALAYTDAQAQQTQKLAYRSAQNDGQVNQVIFHHGQNRGHGSCSTRGGCSARGGCTSRRGCALGHGCSSRRSCGHRGGCDNACGCTGFGFACDLLGGLLHDVKETVHGILCCNICSGSCGGGSCGDGGCGHGSGCGCSGDVVKDDYFEGESIDLVPPPQPPSEQKADPFRDDPVSVMRRQLSQRTRGTTTRSRLSQSQLRAVPSTRGVSQSSSRRSGVVRTSHTEAVSPAECTTCRTPAAGERASSQRRSAGAKKSGFDRSQIQAVSSDVEKTEILAALGDAIE